VASSIGLHVGQILFAGTFIVLVAWLFRRGGVPGLASIGLAYAILIVLLAANTGMPQDRWWDGILAGAPTAILLVLVERRRVRSAAPPDTVLR
jgi:hypothetical protein